MPVNIINNCDFKINATFIKRNLSKVLSFLKLMDYNLNINFVDDKSIRLLNKKYRNIDRATDVLSFSLLEGEFKEINPGKEMGDIVISADNVKKTSYKFNISIEKNICDLSLHGILHIVGFDHDSKKNRANMKEAEALLKKIIKG